MRKKTCQISILFLAILGCASNYPNKDPVDIARDITIEDSSFDDSFKYKSQPVLDTYKRGLYTDYQSYLLRSWKDKKTSKYSHQLYVVITYSGNWRFYEVAKFNGGKTTDVVRISKDVRCHRGCNYTEEIGVDLPEGFLDSSSTKGFSIRIDSISGHNNTVNVPSNYITGHLIGIGAR